MIGKKRTGRTVYEGCKLAPPARALYEKSKIVDKLYMSFEARAELRAGHFPQGTKMITITLKSVNAKVLEHVYW